MKKKILIGLAVLLTAAIAVFVLLRGESPKKSTATSLPGKINYAPPTEQEKRETEQFKRDQQKKAEEPPIPQDPSTKKTVTPEITFAAQYDTLVEASAFIPGIIEEGGTCTYAFTSGQLTVTKTKTGVKDATTTRCPTVSEPANDFNPKGKWSLVVKYQSDKAEGSSQSVSFEVK